MSGQAIGFMLLGGLLVAIGVVAGAVADRIRNIRGDRRAERQLRAPVITPSPAPPERDRVVAISEDLGDQVVEALVASGYKKAAAKGAVWSCGASDRQTLESWTRAALRAAAGGQAS
jgi:hypothetical protein